MCKSSPDVMQKLETTVKQFLDEGRAFTGYDITIETRTREKMQLRHNDVRGDVHEVQALVDAIDFGYDSGTGQAVAWQKTLCPIGPQGQGVFVYHPSTFDPKQYQPRQTSGSPAAPVAAGSPAPMAALIAQAANGTGSAASDSGGDNGDGTFSTDFRKRLLVQKRFMVDLNLKPKESAFVSVENGKVVIMGGAALMGAQGNGGVATLAVERNGNLYLSSKILSDAGLTDSKFKIETVDDGTSCRVVEVTQS